MEPLTPKTQAELDAMLFSATNPGEIHNAAYLGADTNITDADGKPVLFRFARADMVRALLMERADPSKTDWHGRNFLHYLSDLNEDLFQFSQDNGYADMIRMALEHGAPVDATNGNGETPMHCISLGGSPIGAILAEYGADLQALNQVGVAAWQQWLESMPLGTPERRQTLKKILDSVNPNTTVTALITKNATPMERLRYTTREKLHTVPAWADAECMDDAKIFAEHPETCLTGGDLDRINNKEIRQFYAQTLRRQLKDQIHAKERGGGTSPDASNADAIPMDAGTSHAKSRDHGATPRKIKGVNR